MLAAARERHPRQSVGRIWLLSSPFRPGGGGEGLGERGGMYKALKFLQPVSARPLNGVWASSPCHTCASSYRKCSNSCAASPMRTPATTALLGTPHLKTKQSLTCVTRQIPPPRHHRCQVMPSAHPIDGKWQAGVATTIWCGWHGHGVVGDLHRLVIDLTQARRVLFRWFGAEVSELTLTWLGLIRWLVMSQPASCP